MRIHAFIGAAVLAAVNQPAFAQDPTTADPSTQTTATTGGNGTSFRGFRAEAQAGGDRFQALGRHNDKVGYGGAAGFDGQIGDKIVIGPEFSYWHGDSQNCAGGVAGGTVCTKSFQEYGGAIRAGYLVTPQVLVYAKGGYVNNEQRKFFTGTATEAGFYNHYHTDGYQVGGGVEYSLNNHFYVNAEYKLSDYDDHTLRQRALLGAGVRFP